MGRLHPSPVFLAAYAAVAAIASGHREVTLTVPGRLDTPAAWKHVLLKVRKHARAHGIQAHAQWQACRDDDGSPVTEFAVRPGSGRRPPLTPTQANAIRRAYARGGVTQRQVAARYGISKAAVWKIVRGG